MVNGYAARAASITVYDCESVTIERHEDIQMVSIVMKGTDPYRDTRIHVFSRGDYAPTVTIKEPAIADATD